MLPVFSTKPGPGLVPAKETLQQIERIDVDDPLDAIGRLKVLDDAAKGGA
jgi:hypothetical protein